MKILVENERLEEIIDDILIEEILQELIGNPFSSSSAPTSARMGSGRRKKAGLSPLPDEEPAAKPGFLARLGQKLGIGKDWEKEVEKLLNERKENPIKDYKGMWKPLPKPLSKMKRNELIKYLQEFRDIWEKITTRNQDLHDDRLNMETDEMLRDLLEFYFSDDAKRIAEDYLR